MRISTTQLYTEATRNMLEGQSKLAGIQSKISSGKNFTSLAEDPVGASRVVSLKRELSQLDTFKSNIDSTRRRLSLGETAISDITNGVQRAEELIIQAGNGGLSSENRLQISYELEEMVEYLAGLMNARDAKGEYLFSGSKGTTQTFQKQVDGTYTYEGDSTVRKIQVASSQYIESTDSGQFLFQSVTMPAGSSVEGNVLNTLVQAIESIRNDTGAQLGDGIATALDRLSQVQSRLSEAVSTIGGRLNILDSAEMSNEDFDLLTQGALSAIEDLDYAAASTELAKRQLALEASYASFAKIQNLSLFNYIG